MTTLNLTPKIKNSPTLAIRKFIHDHFLYFGKGHNIMTTQKLWNKFRINDEYSTIIRKFQIDYLLFKEIAEPVLECFQVNEVRIVPIFQTKFKPLSRTIFTTRNKNF